MSASEILGTLSHCAVTAILCVLGLYWIGPAFYLGREIAQAEYRYIEAHGGKRDDCPIYCGLIPSAWTVKGMLDWILPLCFSAGFVYFFTF